MQSFVLGSDIMTHDGRFIQCRLCVMFILLLGLFSVKRAFGQFENLSC